ncbi:unnamed protein product [Ostreobium quekettii]|uniref:SP-RING-type domain-containing protein n=1 Tax=Ostreobium quekettii TaxID=121088 RepID=A0A8S1J6V5_9CHLO|nr:unnamed protein product [Ostreobium quekettii]
MKAQGLAYRQALAALRNEYTMGDDPTNFAALIAAEVAQIQSDRVAPQETDEYKNLVRDMERRLTGGELLEDEDIVLDETQHGMDGLANTVCPISGKNVLDLHDPVQDERGFIYEREVIEAYIKEASRNRSTVTCPVAGTSHKITVASLRPAAGVISKQRQAKANRRQSMDEDIL